MPLSVGELAVQLEARTREFTSRMEAAERRIVAFENRAQSSTRAAGLSFRSLVGPLVAVGGALGAIGAVRSFKGITEGAIQGAAAFEGYEVRLRTLLNSQEAANNALDEFVALSTRTPFAVEQIVGGAATLASVAGGSREELEELTLVSANLAAVTGLNYQEAAGNLQRALAGGIAAADLFRERGVRKLIEEVQGIPDLTKVPLEEQRRLFKATFGSAETAPYGRAAEDLSQTVSGALSNIGDAADNASRAFGMALSPATFGTARAAVIPLFESLRDVIVENQQEITDFAVEGVAGLIRSFARLLDTGADFLEFLDRWGIQLGDIGKIIAIVQDVFRVFFGSVRLGFKTLVTGAALLGEAVARVGEVLGLVDPADVGLIKRFREESFEQLAVDAEDFRESAGEALFQTTLRLSQLTDEGESFAGTLRSAADAAERGADAVEKQAARFQELRRQAAQATDEQAALARRRQADIDAMIAGINEEFAEIDREFNEQVLTGKIELDTSGIKDASDEVADVFKRSLGQIWDDLSFSEPVQSFADSLAEVSSQAFEDSMRKSIASLAGDLKDLLGDAFSGLGEAFGGTGFGQWLSGLGGEGGADWGAGLSAAASLGGQILTGALRDTDQTVRNSLVRSAVTSTQAVRGVVAGPSAIPIAEVGNAIRDAQGEQVSELRRGNRLLESILDAIRSAEAPAIDIGEAIAAVIATEIAGTPALG